MLSEDPKFKSGWKYHVWSIVKDFEKFQDGNIRTIQIQIPSRDGFEYVS